MKDCRDQKDEKNTTDNCMLTILFSNCGCTENANNTIQECCCSKDDINFGLSDEIRKEFFSW